MTAAPALVTGAPGWLGTRLVRALRHGLSDVPGLDTPSPTRPIRCLVFGGDTASLQSAGGPVDIVTGDLRDPAAVAAFVRDAAGGTLFHASGVIHPARVRDFWTINVDGTREVLTAAAAAGVRRAVVVSSNSPVGMSRDPAVLFDEDTPLAPYQNYGRSKQAMEASVAEIAAATGLETVVLRPCWFFGPGQPERQTRFFRMIRAGRAPLVGGGIARRSISYVDDVCQALRLAETTAGARGRTYWIAAREPYPMREIVDTVARLLADEFGLPVTPGRLRLPGFASDLAQIADTALQATGRYNQEIHVLSEMNRTIACRIGRAERELGYRPTVDLAEGMRRSIRWCLEQGVAL